MGSSIGGAGTPGVEIIEKISECLHIWKDMEDNKDIVRQKCVRCSLERTLNK